MQSWKQSSIRALRFATASLTRPRLDHFTLFAVSLAVLGTISVLFRQVPYGAGITGDSIAYISTAQNLLEENRFATWSGQIYADFPPLFPLLLALIGIFGYDPIESAGPLNAVMFGLTVFVSALYLRRRIQSRFLLIWTCVALVSSWPLATISFWADTEASFIFFTVLSLFSFDRFLETGKHPPLIWAAIFTALACLDRYIGVSLAWSMVLLLWQRREMPVRKKARASLVYAIIALSPLCLWLLRNLLLIGKPTGTRPPRLYSFQENVESGLITFGEWIVGPAPFNKLIGWLTATLGREFSDSNLGAFLVTMLALGLLVAGFGPSFIYSYRRGGRYTYNSVPVFVVFLLFYLLSTTIAVSVQGAEPLHNRYLSPVYIPMIFIVGFALDPIFQGSKNLSNSRDNNCSRVLRVSLIGLLCSWLMSQADVNIGQIRRLTNLGIGYGSREWTESETIRYLKLHLLPQNIRIFNNDSRGLYIHTHTTNAKAQLYALPTSLEKTRDLLGVTQETGSNEDIYIVWLRASATVRRYGYHLADLLAFPGMELVARLADGVVLRIGENKTDNSMDVWLSIYQSTIDSTPIIRSSFDVYLDQNYLTYVKHPCVPLDVAAHFYLHIFLRDFDDLPVQRQRWNFDNRDFDFYESSGVHFDDKCIVTVSLPYSDIRHISTGQYTDEGRLWEAGVSFGE